MLVRGFSREVDLGDSYVILNHTSRGSAPAQTILVFGRKGEVDGDFRTDETEMLVLREDGTFSLVVIGENGKLFNRLYNLAGGLAPSFWGRQVERAAPKLIEESGLRIENTRTVRQSGYPSRKFANPR